MLELRAATQLARLWIANDNGDQVSDLLRPIFNSFTEGTSAIWKVSLCLEFFVDQAGFDFL